jgi:exopolysaccharide biosynthesis polyprenyl glycosylphosphotransferase
MNLIIKILKKGRIYLLLLGLIDFISLSLSFQVSYIFITGIGNISFFGNNPDYLRLYYIMLPVWGLLILATGNAQIPRTRRYSRIFTEFLQFSLFHMIALELVSLLIGHDKISLLFLILVAVFALIIIVSMRLIEYKFFKLYRSKGHNFINVVLIADGQSELFVEDILNRKEWGYRVLLMVTNSKLLRAKFGDRVKIISEKGFSSLKTYFEIDIVDEVIFSKNKYEHDKISDLIRWCEELGIVFKYPAGESRLLLTNGIITYIKNNPFVTFVNIPMNTIGITWKNFIDFFASFTALVLLSPILFLLALIIKLDSKGPVFFKQARVGLRGRQFYLYKFRTMVVNAEEIRKKLEAQNEMDGPVFKIKNDPRITKVGSFLRKTGLDEIPQIINVLKGEMSLIGPRPPLMSEVKQYKRWQLRRLSVRPGITGLWQVQPNRNAIKFEKWMELDLEYIDDWSPRLDTLLLFKTVKTVLFRTGS